MLQLKEMTHDIRSRNIERIKLSCLMCNNSFNTTRGTRICGKCHKLVDNRYYDTKDELNF